MGRVCDAGNSLPCLDSKCDSSVINRKGDIFLCESCYESRFPTKSAVVSNTAQNSVLSMAVSAFDNEEPTQLLSEVRTSSSTTTEWVKNEMLCFLTDKCAIIPVDQLVDICVKFYKEYEVIAARQVLFDDGVSMQKRKGANRIISTVEDIVKILLKPKVKLPTFVASTLSRLPLVDIKHCDISAILLELQGLRSEVRDIANVQAEVVLLQSENLRLKQEMLALRSELPALQGEIHKLVRWQTE
jgi:hypothetical protein